MSLESVTADYLQKLTGVGGLYSLAALAKAGLLDAYYAGIIAAYEAHLAANAITLSSGGGAIATGAAGAAAAGVIPVVTAVGVWVALGSGYYQARQEAKREESLSGFSQGFVMAIIGWKWNHVVSRFRRPYLRINKFDEQMDAIRVNSYHAGLTTGYLAGLALTPDAKKEYSRKIRRAGNVHGPKEWSRNEDEARLQQVSYVIEMAAAALRYQILKAE